jgi:glycosyltransferase involved in cell wall biosynthesis
VSGVLVPERDDEELAWALLNAVEDRHFLSQVARNGAEVVREKFNLRLQARRLEDAYLKTIL